MSRWQRLRSEAKRLREYSLATLLQDPERLRDFRLEPVPGLLVDYARQPLDAGARNALLGFAADRDLEGGIQSLFAGQRLNLTEQRAALHVALRATEGDAPIPRHAIDDARDAREAMFRWSEALRGGALRGATGQVLDTLVNIGIGGSDLGPRLVVDALGSDGPAVHFVANIDGSALASLLASLDPQRVLFCVTSKSFGTIETLTNARTARAWLRDQLGVDDVGAHFLAVSSNVPRAVDFGVYETRILPMSETVGGRYSLWSTVGFSIAAALGSERFEALLSGARALDRHVLEASLGDNAAVLLALLGLWQRNVLQRPTHAVVAYDQRLRLLPAWMQQLDMESNGKSVGIHGETVTEATGPVIWGGVGTNAQHAFFQHLHQSPQPTPIDLIGVAQPDHHFTEHHDILLANLLGQAKALVEGRPHQDPHRAFGGNRGSTLLLLDRLDPFKLGALLALYEHKVFCQAWLWGINPFDQFGVELGKELAQNLAGAVAGHEEDVDDATAASLEFLRRHRSR